MKLRILILLLAICTIPASASKIGASQNLKNDLRRLDEALDKSQEYIIAHTKQVESLRKKFSVSDLSPQEEYTLYTQMFHLQRKYNFDLTQQALNQRQRLAETMKDPVIMADVNLSRAFIYCVAGMYLESEQAARTIDTTQLSPTRLLDYYNYKQRFYSDYKDNSIIEDIPEYSSKISFYRNSIISRSGDDSYNRNLVMTKEFMDRGMLSSADSLSSFVLAKLSDDSHEYAEFAYYKARIREAMGREDEALHWYINSAIADIKTATKDNASLQCVATSLMNKGVEIERAFRYSQTSLDDAIFFNAKLRPWQIALTLPAIENAYNQVQERHKRTNRLFTIICIGLAILLLYFCMHLFRVNRKQVAAKAEMEEMNKRIQEAVQELSVANAAKEEYIGLFLTMCSNYIDKLKKYMTMKEIDAEIKSFHKTFDNAFLQLYPNFVEDFNKLMKPESRIELKKDELLNTELRIFALIKLGITQSSHIAALLRYSVNTIYNYRAQVKNGALEDKENFEEAIKRL